VPKVQVRDKAAQTGTEAFRLNAGNDSGNVRDMPTLDNDTAIAILDLVQFFVWLPLPKRIANKIANGRQHGTDQI
jgi:hypothetical protein